LRPDRLLIYEAFVLSDRSGDVRKRAHGCNMR
jgi:hypothetical protein